MVEIPGSAGQTAFTGTVSIPVQASGNLYVYAKCKPAIGTLVASAYVPVAVTGGTGKL
jgi:hypothetical protein